jgi:hypothetical protein
MGVAGRQQQVFLTTLRALRNSLAASVDMIDVILDAAEQPVASTEPCDHPMSMRLPKAGMGHPHRFHCRQCQQDVEG